MDINVYLEKKITIKNIQFQKMLFINNAINDGWCVKKENNSYIFTKPHNNIKEVFKEEYLTSFMNNNFDVNTVLS
jgi:hypothetical protein